MKGDAKRGLWESFCGVDGCLDARGVMYWVAIA